MKFLWLFFLLTLSASAQEKGPRFIFIVDFVLPDKISGVKEPLGGLSGIAYDAKTKSLLAVSDDRGLRGPLRAYRFSLNFDPMRVPASLPKITANAIKPLYLKNIKDLVSVDYEAIVQKSDGTIYISSEGDQRLFANTAPAISAFDANGQELFQFPLPKMFWQGKDAAFGVKSNRAFEGLTIDAKEEFLYASTEGPLAQDEKTQLIRIQEFNLKERKPTRQFTYPITTVGDNGVSELLSAGERKFFVLERQYLKQKDQNIVKIFEADCRQADDSQTWDSLAGKKIVPCSKRMLLDVSSIIPQIKGNYKKIDNLEGMAWGPELPGGGRWFFLISDNNFNGHQRTQILAFHWFPH